MTFDPKKHMLNMKGKDYLEVKWRLVWFKDDHPQGGVKTEVLYLEPLIVIKATILTADGVALATGHGTAQAKQGAVWAGREIEKAETAAIGRALAHAGYGTQFTDEDEGAHLADSPVERKNAVKPSVPNVSPASTPVTSAAASTEPRWADDPKQWAAFLKSAGEKLALGSVTVSETLERFEELGLGDWRVKRSWALAALIAEKFEYNREATDNYTSGLPGNADANFELGSMAKQIIAAVEFETV